MKTKINIVMFIILLILFNSSVYATSSQSIGKIDATSSSSADIDVLSNQTNGVFLHYYSLMNEEDKQLAINCLRMNLAGYKEAWDIMLSLMLKYAKSPDYVTYYVLTEPEVIPFAHFNISDDYRIYNNTEGTIFGEPVTDEDLYYCNRIWDCFLEVFTFDELSHFNSIFFTHKGDKENGVTISPTNKEMTKWSFDVSIDLIRDIDTLQRNIVNALVYYHALNGDNVEWNYPKSSLYSIYGVSYKYYSPINQFYKRFWKGMKIELNMDQTYNYSKDFVSSKASRTCHDDFFESFYNYVKKGVTSSIVRNDLITQKINFFDKFDEYKNLAERLRFKIK